MCLTPSPCGQDDFKLGWKKNGMRSLDGPGGHYFIAIATSGSFCRLLAWSLPYFKDFALNLAGVLLGDPTSEQTETSGKYLASECLSFQLAGPGGPEIKIFFLQNMAPSRHPIAVAEHDFSF